MKTFTRSLLLALFLGPLLLTAEAVSIIVAPTAVYLDHETRSATVTLFNPGDAPEEVSVTAIFGYPTTDAEGRLHLHTAEETDDPRSAAEWLRAYPERVIVPPGGRQTIRLLGDPPADLPDGEYWARLAVTSRGETAPIGGLPDESDVHVGVDMQIRTVIAANYRKGPLTTGLAVENFEPRIDEGVLIFRPRFARQGSAAYIAQLTLSLEDREGTVMREWQEQIAVYREYERRFQYPVADLGPGPFILRAHFTTDRSDVPEAFRLVTEPVELHAPVVGG
jgi:hypothetical protein